MKYPVKAANGHAGEYFFAYQVASVLKWPCRLIDIDIGIDAQVEVINDDRLSTGRFVAFQIKASSVEEPNCRYVTDEQLQYWQQLGLPVFVVLVELGKRKMFLHRVSFGAEYERTASGAVRIDFDRIKDIFTKDSERLIRDAAFEASSSVQQHLDLVRSGISRIQETIDAMVDFPDAHSLIEAMEMRHDLYEKLAQAEALATAMKFGEAQVHNVSAELEQVLDDLKSFMTQSFIVDHDDGTQAIQRFVDSRR
ncbi:DUF4365 domain-containing protein [Rhodoferax sp. WC2427]|uniref:DUF4365 domain-containing protein n=1 Tax=Rhodoferax sp. WC2427 TaxID=3234144 RepID=UPI00346626D9